MGEPHGDDTSTGRRARPLTWRRLATTLIAATCGFVGPARAAQESDLASEARAAMAKATGYMQSIAVEGGYVWRYSEDLSQRFGEAATTPTQIWVQPPGTSAMGLAFLRAYEATGDVRHLEAAKAAGHALAVGQLESGGWDYVVDFDPEQAARWYRREDVGKISPAAAAKRRNATTFDDDNTQASLRLLVGLSPYSTTDDARDRRLRQARDYGLTRLLDAQRPNGGWPQRWEGELVTEEEFPIRRARIPENYPREHRRENYYGHYTLNDQTHRDCVMTLLDAAEKLQRAELRAAALKGADFLLLAQLPEPQPAWAQQYNAQMEPAWARAFEPPSVCSNESAGAMSLLLDLYVETGNQKYLEPLPRAFAWFKRSEVAPNRWARLYELGTNKPVYGDRDGKMHYTIEELSPERQRGYSWSGDYDIPRIIARYERLTAGGRDALLKAQRADAQPPTEKQKASRATSLESRVREIITGLDAQGRWLSTYRESAWVRTPTFIENMRVLGDYIEATK